MNNVFGQKNIIDSINRVLFILIGICLISTATAMPPHPRNLVEAAKTGGIEGLISDEEIIIRKKGVNAPSMATSLSNATSNGSFKMLAILIGFADKEGSTPSEFYDSLLFESRQGTVRHYYQTVSYGQLDIITVNLPSTIGWTEAPQTYAYYCDRKKGVGEYPRNTQKLCEDIVDLVDPLVDFSQYDNDGDDTVDAVVFIHSGSGYEYTYDVDDIHSHKWNITPRLKDDVYIYDYTIQPEFWYQAGDMTCGVFCHEIGHIFGLPDMYDPDYSSRGIGVWSIMSYGSWLGPNYDGSCPAEPDAWSRIQLGFTTPSDITSPNGNYEIECVEDSGMIYRLYLGSTINGEYFLVENRQKTGYDSYLPGDGLLIWHIDEDELGTMWPNINEWYPGHTLNGNFGITLEQADGLYQLEQFRNSGDSGDPFPGSTLNTGFSHFTNPISDSYDGENTFISISNISVSGSVMTADFRYDSVGGNENEIDNLLPEIIMLRQNYPNPFNPITNIEIDLPNSGFVSLNIYDIIGRRVNELINGNYPAGMIKTEWNGRDFRGNKVATGIYFYELNTDYGKETKKMILVK